MEAVLNFGGGCQKLLQSCCGECVCVWGGWGALISTAPLAQAMRHPVALGYTAADFVLVYQSGVSFLSFHLSLCRQSCTVVDKNAHTIGARHILYSTVMANEERKLSFHQ